MKFLTLLILGLLASQAAVAQTRSDALADQFKLNQATPQALQDSRLGDKIQNESEHVMRAVYDFTVSGGSVATVSLVDSSTGKPAKLPKGAIIRDCIIDTITTPVSGSSATLALGTGQSNVDLKAATGKATYTGLLACAPVGTAATAIKLTADRTMTVTVGTAALTAGKLYVILHYELSNTQ